MAKKSIGRKAWLSDYQDALVQAAGIAYILGFSDHAKTLHELSCQAMGIDTEANRRQKSIDTAEKTRYHKGNQAENTPRKQEEKKMKKYYYNCPRGFSNEFAIISVEQTNPHEVEKFAEFYDRYIHSDNTNWDLHQITAKRAREIIAAERATKRSYERAGLNLCNNPVGATEITTATDFFSEY